MGRCGQEPRGVGGFVKNMVRWYGAESGLDEKEGEEEGRKTEKGGLGDPRYAWLWEAGWRDGSFQR